MKQEMRRATVAFPPSQISSRSAAFKSGVKPPHSIEQRDHLLTPPPLKCSVPPSRFPLRPATRNRSQLRRTGRHPPDGLSPSQMRRRRDAPTMPAGRGRSRSTDLRPLNKIPCWLVSGVKKRNSGRLRPLNYAPGGGTGHSQRLPKPDQLKGII
jgi:hypothetical protein